MTRSRYLRRLPVWASQQAFAPTQLSGLVLWMDASDASTITLDGSSNVQQWNDKSVSSNNSTQATVLNRPSYVANSLNGLAGIRVTTSKALQLGTRITNAGDFTIFRVAANSGGALVVWHDNTNSTSINTVALSPLYWSGWPGFNTPLVTGTSPTLTSGTWSGPSTLSFRRTSTTGEFWIDASKTTKTVATTTLLFDFAAGGVQTNLASNYIVYESLVYSRSLNDSEVSQVQSYLKSKWATP